MKISQENMSPRIPWYTVTAGPQKLKHARDLIQKRLFCGKDRSENLQTGIPIWSRENMMRVEKDYRGGLCREQKQGTNTESS